jgi:hypothetical protein
MPLKATACRSIRACAIITFIGLFGLCAAAGIALAQFEFRGMLRCE